MSRLVVASNRVADPAQGQLSGGLAVGVLDALRENGGLWFGWDGQVVAGAAEVRLAVAEHGDLAIATMPLTTQDYEEFYAGFSNSVLWPLLHYRLDLVRVVFEQAEGYNRVNERFAEQLAPLVGAGDLVWVHDYHLMPLGGALRRRGIANRIGFFLHIPFPPPEVLTAMPEHERVLSAMLDYDLVGFQTLGDMANFKRCVMGLMDGVMQPDGRIAACGKRLAAGVFPIGIDVDAFAAMAHTPEADEHIAQLQRSRRSRIHIIGVDRLDYTKGLPERLRAFKRLLELHPEHMKAATLMQIAAPTREDVGAYADIREELEKLSGAINGEFGDFDWTPVRYIHRSILRDTLAALFRGSHVGLITPLRDGMNLVAKEYLAAQDDDDPGVLILSRFAGAAEDLAEALIVNPYDADEMAAALQTAIRMSKAERVERHRALIDKVRRHDARNWRECFLAALKTCRVGAAD